MEGHTEHTLYIVTCNCTIYCETFVVVVVILVAAAAAAVVASVAADEYVYAYIKIYLIKVFFIFVSCLVFKISKLRLLL